MHTWYRNILLVGLGFCSFIMPVLAMHVSELIGELADKVSDAIEQNNIQQLTYLFDHEIDVNSKDDSGSTPLHWAAYNGNVEIIALLIDRYGASIESRDNNGKTPLYRALNNREVSALLLDRYSANIHNKDHNGNTPLHDAAERGNLQALALLLERGADIENRNSNGSTPLQLAGVFNNREAIKLLLDSSADISSRDSNNNTVLWYVLRKLSPDFNDQENRKCQEIVDWIVKNKPYYINMGAKPTTLVGTTIMHLLKNNYVSTAIQIAKTLGDDRAHDFLNILSSASTLEQQRQQAKRYIGYYSRKPGTLLLATVRHLLKKNDDMGTTAQLIANTFHDEKAQRFLQAFKNASTPEMQIQEARAYLKYYIERNPEREEEARMLRVWHREPSLRDALY